MGRGAESRAQRRATRSGRPAAGAQGHDPAGHHRSRRHTHYWITIGDGKIDLGVGDIEGEDATITQSYDTAAALAKGELSPVTAFMTGKLKIAGNMGMILGLQGALSQLPAAMAKIDVEY